MAIGLIGKKIGMTREFYKTGQSVPVTVVKMEKGRVMEVISEEKRGYKAVQIGFGKIKNSKLSKAMKGYFTKKNTEPKRKLKEFRVENLENYKDKPFWIDISGNLESEKGIRDEPATKAIMTKGASNNWPVSSTCSGCGTGTPL